MGASRANVVSSFTVIKGSMIEETCAIFEAWDFDPSKRDNLNRAKETNLVGASSSNWLRDVGKVRAFVRDTTGLHKQSGSIGRIPIPVFSATTREALDNLAKRIQRIVFERFMFDETSRWFAGPAFLRGQPAADASTLQGLIAEIDSISCDLLGLHQTRAWLAPPAVPLLYTARPTDSISWALGATFGHFRLSGSQPRTSPSWPSTPPGAASPGMVDIGDAAAGGRKGRSARKAKEAASP